MTNKTPDPEKQLDELRKRRVELIKEVSALQAKMMERDEELMLAMIERRDASKLESAQADDRRKVELIRRAIPRIDAEIEGALSDANKAKLVALKKQQAAFVRRYLSLTSGPLAKVITEFEGLAREYQALQDSAGQAGARFGGDDGSFPYIERQLTQTLSKHFGQNGLPHELQRLDGAFQDYFSKIQKL